MKPPNPKPPVKLAVQSFGTRIRLRRASDGFERDFDLAKPEDVAAINVWAGKKTATLIGIFGSATASTGKKQ